MKSITLSADELIFCFYSEGYFEQANGLRSIYFEELSEEDMQLVLQSATRSLLSKELIEYENSKFHLNNEMKDVILYLNSAKKTIRTSRHNPDNSEYAISFHLTDNGVLKQYSKHDELVHVFEKLTLEETLQQITEFLYIKEEGLGETISMSEEAFEELLTILEQPNSKVDAFDPAQQPFVQHLLENNLEFNTLLFISYNPKNEPTVESIVLVSNSHEKNWLVEKKENEMTIQLSNTLLLRNLINENFTYNQLA